jgi:fumarate reductase subunit D
MEGDKEMNKKVNTLLFVLGATVFNILVTVLVFVALLLAALKLLPGSASAGTIPFVFIASLAASFFIYNKVVKIIMNKVDMDKHFAPIFRPRRRK